MSTVGFFACLGFRWSRSCTFGCSRCLAGVLLLTGGSHEAGLPSRMPPRDPPTPPWLARRRFGPGCCASLATPWQSWMRSAWRTEGALGVPRQRQARAARLLGRQTTLLPMSPPRTRCVLGWGRASGWLPCCSTGAACMSCTSCVGTAYRCPCQACLPNQPCLPPPALLCCSLAWSRAWCWASGTSRRLPLCP